MSTISPGNALPHVSDHAPRHARSSLKKLRVPACHTLTPVTHRPLTHTKHAPQRRVRHMRNATITKQRVSENSRLIIATARHVASGSLHALTRSPHTINKLTKERPRAPLRPGTRATAVSYRHRLQTPLSRRPAPHSPKPPTQGVQRHSHAHATKSAHAQQRVNFIYSQIIYTNARETPKPHAERNKQAAKANSTHARNRQPPTATENSTTRAKHAPHLLLLHHEHYNYLPLCY